VFDYLLTQHWGKYSAENIYTFTSRVYDTLDKKKDAFPPRLRELLPKMIADDFLMSCSTEERLIKTFVHIKKRAKFDNHFDTAHQDLFDNYEAIDLHFNTFFPELMTDIHQFCDCN
ncbi:MAG: acyl carrier protein phosphodiesterase, partial [Saprospiraceae bacterium]